MADATFRWWEARCWMTPQSVKIIRLKDLGPETYLTRKSAKNYAEWSNPELLERSGVSSYSQIIVFVIFHETSNSGCNCS